MLTKNMLIIKQVLLLSCFIYILLLVLGYLLQRHFIYFPSKVMPDRKTFHAEDMQVISLLTPDHLRLQAWYKPAQHNQPTLLYLHGNAGHIGYRIFLTRQFLSKGLGVLLLEYRGYGGNPGSPTEAGLYEDGRAGIHFLQQQHVKKIVLFGESLGTGVATKLATEFQTCALVLQSPYTSFTALSRYHYPFLPIPIRDKYDSLKRISSIHVPLLILHGKQDTIVPYSQGQTLFQHANEPKEWVTFEHKGHHDLWDADFARQIILFIEKHCS